jgi:hypothetical protein
MNLMNVKLLPRRRAGLFKALAVAGLISGAYIVGCATAAQPHMVNALNALQTARAELSVAEHDKGGHLPIAIQRVDEAINQVRLGMAAAGG